MKILCECNGDDCHETIELPLEVAQERLKLQYLFIIAESCLHGAEPTDTFVTKEEGYSIYREG